MVVGKVYYIISNYNENKFRTLLEEHLSKAANVYPPSELIEQVIAAHLACKDVKASVPDISSSPMNLNVSYVDKRNYSGTPLVGNPAEAILAFNQLMIAYNLSKC